MQCISTLAQAIRLWSHKVKLNLKLKYRQIYGDNALQGAVEISSWGVSYSVFDGEELLEYSLRSIRAQVDYINVVYQTKSWFGEPCSDNLLDVLKRCQEAHLIDELIEYVPNLSRTARFQEREKRNIGLQHAIKAGCDYFMPMDCDELYIENELKAAKKYIIKHKITISYVLQIKYAYSPKCRELNYVGYVGFFSLINKQSVLGNPDSNSPCLIDSTCRISPPFANCRYFVLPSIKMHHMELVRKDLTRKVKNSSWNDSGKIWTMPSCVPDENDRTISGEYVIVENQFNIKI